MSFSDCFAAEEAAAEERDDYYSAHVVRCETEGCTEPHDYRVKGYDLACTACAIQAIVEELKEDNTDYWRQVYLDDLARLGWVAK